MPAACKPEAVGTKNACLREVHTLHQGRLSAPSCAAVGRILLLCLRSLKLYACRHISRQAGQLQAAQRQSSSQWGQAELLPQRDQHLSQEPGQRPGVPGLTLSDWLTVAAVTPQQPGVAAASCIGQCCMRSSDNWSGVLTLTAGSSPACLTSGCLLWLPREAAVSTQAGVATL